MHVPRLPVVPGQLRVDRVLDEQLVQPRGGVCAVALGAGHEERAELGPELAEGLQLVARDVVVQVLPVGHERAQPVQRRELVAALVAEALGVHEPDREFSIGRQIHWRSLAAGNRCNGLVPVLSITQIGGCGATTTPSMAQCSSG